MTKINIITYFVGHLTFAKGRTRYKQGSSPESPGSGSQAFN